MSKIIYRNSKDVAAELVKPGIDSIRNLRKIEISKRDLVNIYMMSRMALYGKRRGLDLPQPTPEQNEAIIAIANSINQDASSLEVYQRQVSELEKWIYALRKSLGKISKANLASFVTHMSIDLKVKAEVFNQRNPEHA